MATFLPFRRHQLLLAAAVLLACAAPALAAVPANGGFIVQSDPGTVAGILVGGMLIFILSIGLCCLGDIQTPTRIANTYPMGKKEF